MTSAAKQRIYSTISSCLDECYAAETPVACLAAYAERLRNDPDWSEREVQEFERAVLRTITQLAAQPATETSRAL